MTVHKLLILAGVSFLLVLASGVFWPASEHATASGTRADSVSTGVDHTCAVTPSGGVRCWGDNDDGQLGNGSPKDYSAIAVSVSGLLSTDVVAAGGDFSCALLSANGAVKCWGTNDAEQTGNSPCGNPCTSPVDVLAPAPPLTDAIELSAGDRHACAVVEGGEVYCWGSGDFGRLGLGVVEDPLAAFRVCQTGVYKGDPQNPCSRLDDAASVTAGGRHTCVVTEGATVKCWGSNEFKQLGENAASNSEPNPVNVCASGSIATEDCVLLADIDSVAAGGHHTCAVTTSGEVNCWGSTSSGQAGHTEGCIAGLCIPGEVGGLTGSATAVVTGTAHTCALNSSGGVQCWGANGDGQLGDGSNDNSGTPVDVIGLSSGVAAISSTGNYTCAVTNAGAVSCWGDNGQGQLGDGTTTSSSTPVSTTGIKGGAFAVAAGGFSSLGSEACALTGAGGVKCWGSGNSSRVAPYDICADTATPCTKVSNVAALAAGGAHNCILLDEETDPADPLKRGKVKCWGWNNHGQLGDGTNTNRSIPVYVNLNWPWSVGTMAIVAGSWHTCAVSQLKAVKCWGNNSFGQLGDGTNVSRNSPVDISGGHNTVLSLAAGRNYTCFRTEDSTAMCWGHNSDGQLGDGTTTFRNVPVDVCETGATAPCNPGNMNVLNVAEELAAGMRHTCARTTSGGVKCWGRDAAQALGNGSEFTSSVPVDVCDTGASAPCNEANANILTGVTAIGAGWEHACAVQAGNVKCWGWNATGALGDATTVNRDTPVDVCATGATDCVGNPLTGILALEAGGFLGNGYTCAVTDSSSAKCWGDNFHGQLGAATTEQCGSTACSTTPLDVIGLGVKSGAVPPPPVPAPCSGGGSSGDALLMIAPMLGLILLGSGRRRRKL